MAVFKYTALDPKTNQESVGTISASNKKNATAKIRNKGLFPSNVEEVKGAAKTPKKTKGRIARGCQIPSYHPSTSSFNCFYKAWA